MKRLISVLAITLILILATWDNASSMRFPNITIEVVHFDHPWGGEQNTTNPPAVNSTTPIVKDDFIIVRIMKYWNYRILHNASTLIKPEVSGTTTTTTETNTNQATSQRGTGQ